MRLIDADALIKSIESDRDCSDMPSQWIDGVNYAIDLIKLYEPTIDTVEVVRCKECKHWDNEDDAQRCSYTHNGLHWAKPDDFCSYGERKEKEITTDCSWR